jgi:hypothetical protein
MIIYRVAGFALVWATLVLAGTARADTPGAADRLATLIQFYSGGAPLSEADTADIADITRQCFATDPQQAAQNDALNAKIIATLNKHNPRIAAKLRSLQRYYYAAGGGGATPAQRAINDRVIRIVNARDPVVVLDTAHKGVITRHVADLMLQVNAAAAPFFGVPGPTGVTVAAFGARIKADFPSMPSDTKAAMAAAELNMPNGLPWLRDLKPNELAAYVAKYKPAILAASDPVEQQVRLAEAMAATDMTGAQVYDAFIKKMMTQSFLMSRQRMGTLLQNRLNSTATGY